MYKRERRGLVFAIAIPAAIMAAIAVIDRIPDKTISDAIEESVRLRTQDDRTHRDTINIPDDTAEAEAKTPQVNGATEPDDSASGARYQKRRKDKAATKNGTQPTQTRNPLDDVVPRHN